MDVVEKYNKGAKALSTGDDVREEMVIMNSENANWGELIMPAPLAISLLAQLMLISTKADFKLDTPQKELQYVKYPNSFRASLVQVSNCGWEAFNKAHSSMLQIAQHSGNVPTKVKNAVACLLQGSPSDVSIQLPKILKSIMDTADECTALAKGVEDKFEFVILLTSELQELCTLTKGTTEQKIHDAEATKKAFEIMKEQAKEEKERADKIYSEMESSLKTARQNFEDAAKDQPNGWNLIGMNLVEGLSNVVVNTLSFGSQQKPQKSKSKAKKKGKAAPENTERLDTSVANAEVLSTVVASLQTLVDGGKIDAQRIQNPQNGPQFIKTLLTAFGNTNAGSHAETVADLSATGIEIVDTLNILSGNMNQDQTQISEYINKINHWCGKAQAFTATAKLSSGQISRASGIAAPMGAPPSAPNSAVAATVQNWQFKVQETRMVLSETRGSFEKACQEQREASQNLAKMISQIAEIDIQKINFDQIRKVLTQGIKALAELKVQWGKLVQFFQQVSTVIKVAMNDSVKAFTSSVASGREQSLGGVPLTQYLKNTLYQEAMHASKVAHHVNLISTVYVDISSNFLMDRIAGLGSLVALDPESDKDEIKRLQKGIMTGCTEAQKAIGERVEKTQREYGEKVAKRIQKIEQTLASVLPPEDASKAQQTKQILATVAAEKKVAQQAEKQEEEEKFGYSVDDMS
eukprot:Phypoly_transcript_04390.p1 GENE.Phypoly_transcript_04390~~Phypoly_transcript_04390.p1  ORF type:complete len:693 (+),score=158.35 Phypoly_transcript_04390:77-2155(+)